MTLVEELRWRGMVHDTTPAAESTLSEKKIKVYAGFDPTAVSLQLGNLVPIMLLLHFQRAGHTPVALVGGATGMIGDPSGKSEERVLQSLDSIEYNVSRFKLQLEKFLRFDGDNAASLVNNFDWFKNVGFLEFLRDVGKHLTVNYMMAKDSVKQRLESGLSFTEFSYQLLQAYDYLHLYKTQGCTFQVGGSDQWGNITAGTELVRRMANGEAHALTCPLVTKADGSKFGKSAAGEKIWLDPALTSPYKFYQFWINTADDEALRYIKIFSMLPQEEIDTLAQKTLDAPEKRELQFALARDITTRVHSEEAFKSAVEASDILFGSGTFEKLATLSEENLLAALEGVPRFSIARSEIEAGVPFLSLCAEKTTIFPSKGEARRMVSNGGVFVNKQRVGDVESSIGKDYLLQNRYILVQKGKKNYTLIIVE